MTSPQSGFQMINIAGPVALAVTILILTLVIIQRRKSTVVVERQQVRDAQANWRAPDGLLNSSLPRAVTYTGTSVAMAVILILLAGGTGVLSWYTAKKVAQNKQETELLHREGVVVDAPVTRKWETAGKNHAWYIAYRYTAPDGAHSVTSSVSSALYRRTQVNANVQVTYAPSNPSINRVEFGGGPPSWVPFFVLFPLLMIVIVPFDVLRQKKLLEYGTPAAAIVERVSPTKGGYVIAYQFIGTNGDAVKGRSSVSGGPKPVAGETITVVYDPERPQRSSRYPLKYVKLADSI